MPKILTPTIINDFREGLCDVAAQLFSEAGYEGFHMRELGKRFGVSAMAPYRYFRDKNEILAMLRTRAFRRLADRLEAAQSRLGAAADRSDTLVRAYIQFAREEHIYYRLMFDLSEAGNHYLTASQTEEIRVRALLAGHADPATSSNVPRPARETIELLLWSALHGAVSLFLSGRIDEAELNWIAPELARAITEKHSSHAEKNSHKLHSAA